MLRQRAQLASTSLSHTIVTAARLGPPTSVKRSAACSLDFAPWKRRSSGFGARRRVLLGLSLAQLWEESPSRQLGRTAAAAAAQDATMRDQSSLVDALKRERVIKHSDVEAAMRAVDRGHFVDGRIPSSFTYQDSPLPIGLGETISAPHMHATCLELLRGHLQPGARVLDVGSGSGYLSAAMALMVGQTGKVVGIEKHPELAEQSLRSLRRFYPHLLSGGRLEIRAGNVLGQVLEEEDPFDALHVGAAASSLPEVLVRKLRPGGRMVIPVGPQYEYQVMQCIDKEQDGSVRKHDLMYVRYVPLTEPGEDPED